MFPGGGPAGCAAGFSLTGAFDGGAATASVLSAVPVLSLPSAFAGPYYLRSRGGKAPPDPPQKIDIYFGAPWPPN